ncbi:MAG: hypothetical protein ABJ171_06150 [Halieaceae bacterium]
MRLLTSIIEEHMRFLIEEYGFSLTTQDCGREIQFDFERGLKTISISVEMGSEPVVRIYGPVSQFGGEIVPSAERLGINRGMRYIITGPTEDFSDREAYIQDVAERLLKDEKDWLEL